MTTGTEQVRTTPGPEAVPPAGGLVKPTGAQLLAAFPPRPVASSWPATEASRSTVLARVLAAPFTLANPGSQQNRRLGVLAVLSWLQSHPGDGWQQRWQASGAEHRTDWRDAVPTASTRRSLADTASGTQLRHLSPGLLVLICADVIRPSLDWLLRFAAARRGLATEMARTRDPAAFAVLAGLCTHGGVGLATGQHALTRVAVILAAKGGRLAGRVRWSVYGGCPDSEAYRSWEGALMSVMENEGLPVVEPGGPAGPPRVSGRSCGSCWLMICGSMS